MAKNPQKTVCLIISLFGPVHGSQGLCCLWTHLTKTSQQNIKAKNRDYTQLMLDAAVHQAGLMMSGGNQTEESFWSFFQGFIYKGRVCWWFGGSVLAVRGEFKAVRWVSFYDMQERVVKTVDSLPVQIAKPSLRTLKSLSSVKDGTNQRKQQQHFNKHT